MSPCGLYVLYHTQYIIDILTIHNPCLHLFDILSCDVFIDTLNGHHTGSPVIHWIDYLSRSAMCGTLLHQGKEGN